MKLRWVLAVVVLGGVLLGVASVLVADSPYDRNVVSEQNPFAPDRPATLNATTATDYTIRYEQTRLHNEFLSTRDHTLDVHDEVTAECTQISVSEPSPQQFRVRLQCTGGIDDSRRLLEPGSFSYRVTYRVTENETRQVGIQDYPYGERESFRTPPA